MVKAAREASVKERASILWEGGKEPYIPQGHES